ncbi:MAG: efflux RND transporter permease subunit [Candidatus Nanohaloarchaea archaeon]
MPQTILGKVTEYQESHPWKVVLIFGLLTLAMVPGMGRIETVVALENMMPADSEPVKEFNELRAQGLGRDAVAVEIQAGKSDEGIQSVTSPEAKKYIKDLGSRIQEVYGVSQVYTPLQQPSLVDSDRDTAVLIVYSYMGDDGQKMSRLFSDVKEEVEINQPEGIETQISGVPAVQQRLARMVERDKNVTTMISLGLVFLITLLLFSGSLTAALMPLLVVGLSVVWLYGTMGYMGLPLSTLAGSVAALIIGIGIAYSIHIGNIYRFNRRENTVEEALVDAVDDIGVSIVASAITTISAFIAFLVGKMPEMHRFGLTMAIGISYAVIFTILLLPAVFVLEERIMAKIHSAIRWRHEFP